MSWDSTLVKMATYTVRGTLRTVGGRVPKDRYKALLTGVIAAVLCEHPDMSPAQAARKAQTATGSKAAPELLGDPDDAGKPSAAASAANGSSASRKSSTTSATRKNRARSAGATKRTTTKKPTPKTARKPAARKRTTRKAARR